MNTTVEQVKQCRTPQEALLVLAAAIDALVDAQQPADPWDQPLKWSDGSPVSNGSRVEFVTPDDRAVIDGNDVVVKPVSEDRQAERHDFAVDIKLAEFLRPMPELDVLAAYIKGGPRWLYYTNRDAVMAMPLNFREALVADVLLDSYSEADEIGRDILKFDESTPQGAQLEALRRDVGPLG